MGDIIMDEKSYRMNKMLAPWREEIQLEAAQHCKKSAFTLPKNLQWRDNNTDNIMMT